MKKLILILISFVILVSCDKHQHRPVITSKEPYIQRIDKGNYYEYRDKDNICKYHYSGLGYSNVDFIDSCCKYSIGDTIHVSN